MPVLTQVRGGRCQLEHLLDPELLRIDPLVGAQRHRAFDDMGQLAHIPRPVILFQHVQRFGAKRRGPGVWAATCRCKNVSARKGISSRCSRSGGTWTGMTRSR